MMIVQHDYRLFEFARQLPFDRVQREQRELDHVHERVNRWLQARPSEAYTLTCTSEHYQLEFATVDTARLFVLSFSDYVDTQGARYE